MGRHRSRGPTFVGYAVAILAVAFNLRIGVTSLGAELKRLVAFWHLSGAESGIVTALPVFTFSLVGAVAPALARRMGPGLLIVWAMSVTAVGLAVRGVAGSVPVFLVATVFALAGAAIGNVLLPPLVKSHFPDRIGTLTALYGTALSLGMTGGAALTGPVVDLLGRGWRAGLALWAVPAVVAAWTWIPVLDRPPDDGRPAAGSSTAGSSTAGRIGVYRSPTARWLTVFFGCQALNAYVVLGWLPSILGDAGLPAAAAGLPLALASSLSIPMSMLVPGLATRGRSQVGLVLATTASYALGYVGLMLAPAALPWLWAVLLGAGNGALPLAITMIGLRSRRPEVTTELSALVQSGGYLLAGLGPLLFGVLHSMSGTWRLPLLLTSASLVAQLVSGLRCARDRAVDVELADRTDRPDVPRPAQIGS